MDWGGKAIMVLLWVLIAVVMVVIMVIASPILIYEDWKKKRMQPKYL